MKKNARGGRALTLILALSLGVLVAGCGGEEAKPDKGAAPTATKPGKTQAGAARGRAAKETKKPRNPKWAKHLRRRGLSNLHRVTDSIYRSGAPKPQGFVELKKMGVKTIINLRVQDNNAEAVKKAGLAPDTFNLVHRSVAARSPSDDDLIAVLKLLMDEKNHPVLIHCSVGVDRTGAVLAVYRMVVEGWSAAEALDEMRNGYRPSFDWRGFPDRLRKLDVAAFRQKLGVDAGAPAGSGGHAGSEPQ